MNLNLEFFSLFEMSHYILVMFVVTFGQPSEAPRITIALPSSSHNEIEQNVNANGKHYTVPYLALPYTVALFDHMCTMWLWSHVNFAISWISHIGQWSSHIIPDGIESLLLTRWNCNITMVLIRLIGKILLKCNQYYIADNSCVFDRMLDTRQIRHWALTTIMPRY